MDVKGQEASLRKGPDIVIATPGRLVDFLHNAPSFDLQCIEILVLDEADRLVQEAHVQYVLELHKHNNAVYSVQVLQYSLAMGIDYLNVNNVKVFH